MKTLLCALMLMLLSCTPAFAWPRSQRGRSPTTPTATVSQSACSNNSSAQGVAEAMANSGSVAHFGGNSGHEGCGCGSTQQAAYNNCCYATSSMATVDVGYAQGRNGLWYCCRRYR